MTLRILKAVAAILTGLVWSSTAFAANTSLLFGEQHSYSVTMRGNGEAVVTARLAITNNTDIAQKTFTFEIPGLTISELTGYQQHLADTCLDSGYPKPLSDNTGIVSRPCFQTQPPDYSINSYYNNSTYAKLTFVSEGGGKYHTTLPTAIEAGKSTALILAYAGKGYATKQLGGAYNFKFQTIKVSDRIKNLVVAIDVDADQFLDGSTAKVGYGTTEPALATSTAGIQPNDSQLDSIASNIGSGGGINKEAKDLAAGESYTITGTYADAVWKLHPWRLLLAAGLGLLMLGLLIWAVLRLKRRGPHTATNHTEAAPVTTTIVEAGAIGVGFISALALVLIIWGWISYYNHENPSDTFTTTVSGILMLLACALALLTPLTWLSVRRHDWRVAVYTGVWQIVWLIGFLTLYTFIIKPTTPHTTPVTTPLYQIESGASSGTGAAQSQPSSSTGANSK